MIVILPCFPHWDTLNTNIYNGFYCYPDGQVLVLYFKICLTLWTSTN